MTLSDAARNLAIHHEECGSESCACFKRLVAAFRGEPDPIGFDFEGPMDKTRAEEEIGARLKTRRERDAAHIAEKEARIDATPFADGHWTPLPEKPDLPPPPPRKGPPPTMYLFGSVPPETTEGPASPKGAGPK